MRLLWRLNMCVTMNIDLQLRSSRIRSGHLSKSCGNHVVGGWAVAVVGPNLTAENRTGQQCLWQNYD